MNNNWQQIKEKILGYWKQASVKQKMIMGSIVLILIASLSLYVTIASKPQMVPLFNNSLTEADVGAIKEKLDEGGYIYEISQDGRNIKVSLKDKPDIIVALAADGIPNSSSIGYSIFEKNLGFGMTEQQFGVIERDAMQGELEFLLKKVQGVRDARVMLTLPKETLWVADENEKATASVIVELDPGIQLNEKQINTLYNLVSKSVPKLPVDNIVITDQNGILLENSQGSSSYFGSSYEKQRKIQKDIEKDIQKQIQAMLAPIVGGYDNLVVQVFAKLNFDQVKSVENLVTPVDVGNNKGITISSEKITETFSGTGSAPGGIVGTGQNAIPGYPSGNENGNSEYERIEERINQEVNRITKEIIATPYRIEDMSIMVTLNEDEVDPSIETTVKPILESIVKTALVNPAVNTDERVSLVVRKFSKPSVTTAFDIRDYLSYIVAGAIGFVLLLFFMIFLRKRKGKEEQEEEIVPTPVFSAAQLEPKEDTEQITMRKQLERLARQKPEEFVKLLRTWTADE
ncbi:flagellar M-ring protein FliF [Microaerobacter geothermalis]|uniref:flagellar basal-body MS-ring/collar protein FliF n=1 Tax=Microaerobacter geothermalis TaxID=674972 RepID=UPI001F15F594|nr:flagellar basal-body MS-ring/collar protein FliF [Microaerobacter geothermalis]MCF6093840.1 flagellar M-ring protein FliF [Microaerobacter geothermalis]